MVARPARESIKIFRQLSGDDEQGEVLYQDVVPASFRHIVYILETVVQFRYRETLYGEQDYLIFDRWRQTWDVYCGPPAGHAQWLSRVGGLIPEPDLLFYVRVDPGLAAERLALRGDRWARVYTPERLLDRLGELYRRYEEVMARAGAVVLDGAVTSGELLASALDQVAALTPADR